MENILLPSKIRIEEGERPHEGVLIVEPCYHGYGTTLGNALRRVLLSSLPGAAVTSMKIKGVTHEFQSIDNIKEDVLEIILNLKLLRMKVHTDEPVKLTIKVSGKKIVTGKDIDPNSDVEIVNKDLKIVTLTDDKASIEMELVVERGRGYSATDERTDEKNDIGSISIDALFSPVRNVGYKVEDTRVGKITNYDKLIMTIETDGTITPEEAVELSSKMLIDYFSLLTQTPPTTEEEAESPDPVEVVEEEVVEEKVEETKE